MPIPGPSAPNTGYTYGETVVRLRAQLVADPYSGENTLPAWDDPDRPPAALEITGCTFDPGTSNESVQLGRDPIRSQPTLLHPSVWLDVTASDRIEAQGRIWQVDGDPGAYRNPLTGWEAGTVIRLKAVEG